jgi:hypothetical protein
MSNQSPTVDFMSAYAKQLLENQKKGISPPYKPPAPKPIVQPQPAKVPSPGKYQSNDDRLTMKETQAEERTPKPHLIKNTPNKPITNEQSFRYLDQENMKAQEAAKLPTKDSVSGYTEQLIKNTPNKPITTEQRFRYLDQENARGRPEENLLSYKVTGTVSTGKATILPEMLNPAAKTTPPPTLPNAADHLSFLESRAAVSPDWFLWDHTQDTSPSSNLYNEIMAAWPELIELADPNTTLDKAGKDTARHYLKIIDQYMQMHTTDFRNIGFSDIDLIYSLDKEMCDLSALSYFLNVKIDALAAFTYGAADVVPGAVQNMEEVKNSLVQHKYGAVDEVLKSYLGQGATSIELLKRNNPGAYLAGSLYGNTALGLTGNELFGGLAPALRNAVVSGAIGAINSAPKQDWSKPGQALAYTTLDTLGNAALGYTVGETLSTLDDFIKDWHGTKQPVSTAEKKWPETIEELQKLAKGNINGNINGTGYVITEIYYNPSSGAALKATPGKTTTILGSYYKDLKYIIDEMGNIKSTSIGPNNGGFNVLNIPDELYAPDTFWDLYNKLWLDEAINRGDDIVLATKPDANVLTRIDYATGEEVLTGFGKEYNYLIKKGYIYDAVTNIMKMK